MGKTDYPYSFKLANVIYKKCYSIYKPLYFYYKKITERQENALFTRLIKKGMTVVDIGGNIGYYTLLFSKLVGESGKVHVFEPDLINFNHLISNTIALKNVIANNCAVGELTQTLTLYQSDDLNVDHQTYDSGENRSKTEVPCISIDDYFRNGEMIDFIKIDIQGYDYFALRGMVNLISRSKNIKIFGEFWPYGLHKAGVDPLEYLHLLKNMGFILKMQGAHVDDNYSEKINDKLFYINYYGEKQ